MPDPSPDQQQPQQQENPPIVFGKFDGYTNTIDRERLSPRDLAKALNIDLDDAGQAHRRRGTTVVAAGSYHSLWNANDQTVYGVKDGELGIIRPDYSFVDRGVPVGDGPNGGLWNVAFGQIGDSIYFTHAAGSGIITHSTGDVNPWGPSQDIWLSPVVNPTATLPPVRGKLLGAPPFARFIAIYAGRIYLAAGNLLWATEFHLYNYVDKTRTFFQFEGEITMVAAVADGLFVGTDEGVYFLGGPRLEELKRVRVMDSPVIPGSAVVIPAELGNPPQVGLEAVTPMEVAVVFMSTRGMCIGEDGGKCSNLTEARVFFPVAQRAAAFFRRQDGMNHYVVCNDSQGDPVNGARFGDFVDAEIIRGNVSWVSTDDNLSMTEKAQ